MCIGKDIMHGLSHGLKYRFSLVYLWLKVGDKHNRLTNQIF